MLFHHFPAECWSIAWPHIPQFLELQVMLKALLVSILVEKDRILFSLQEKESIMVN